MINNLEAIGIKCYGRFMRRGRPFKPKDQVKVHFNGRLEPKVWRALRNYADESDLTMSEIVNRILRSQFFNEPLDFLVPKSGSDTIEHCGKHR